MNIQYGMFYNYLFPYEESESNCILSMTTRKSYAEIIKRYILEYNDVEDVNLWTKFLIQTGSKKRMYANKYACFYFIRFIKPNAEGERMITEIKQNTKSITLLDDKKYSNIVPLNDEEKSNIMNNLEEEKHRIIFLLEYITGWRTHDVLSIPDNGIQRLKDNKGDECLKLNTTDKGGKKQKVAWVYGEPVDIVWDFINSKVYSTGNAFVSPPRCLKHCPLYKNIALNYNSFWLDIKNAMIKCDIARERFAPHRLRHGYGLRIWDKYKDLNILKTQLGHSRIETSFRYLHNTGLDKQSISKELQF